MRQIRRAKSPEFWKKHIETWHKLGDIPLTEYCKGYGLLEILFIHWIEKSNRRKKEGEIPVVLDPDQWVKLMPDMEGDSKETCSETTHCELEFRNGTRLIIKSEHACNMLIVILPLVIC
jgi:hypothetical protein